MVRPSCQPPMRIIAFVLNQVVIDTILRHLKHREADRERGGPTPSL